MVLGLTVWLTEPHLPLPLPCPTLPLPRSSLLCTDPEFVLPKACATYMNCNLELLPRSSLLPRACAT